jgi:prepilin-type N-terminal cleavage/methylation domain-containing protein/prepilin-type processing-associated H-X9-DG protein
MKPSNPSSSPTRLVPALRSGLDLTPMPRTLTVSEQAPSIRFRSGPRLFQRPSTLKRFSSDLFLSNIIEPLPHLNTSRMRQLPTRFLPLKAQLSVQRNSKESGFTLTELLVVIAIIAVLTAIIIPVAGKIRSAGNTAKCISNLKQITSVYLLTVQDNNGLFLPSNLTRPGEVTPIYRNLNWDQALSLFLHNMGQGERENRMRDLSCPAVLKILSSDHGKTTENGVNKSTYGLNSYLNRLGGNGLAIGATRMDQLVDPSATILFGDSTISPTGTPDRSINGGAQQPVAYHGKHAHLSYADGHVRVVLPSEIPVDPPPANSSRESIPWRGY